jgi:hypothetical protein
MHNPLHKRRYLLSLLLRPKELLLPLKALLFLLLQSHLSRINFLLFLMVAFLRLLALGRCSSLI